MKMQYLKNFFVFEGIDGAGTTTQLKLTAQKLSAAGIKVYTTCEPTDFDTGKFLRSCLTKKITVCPETMVALFAADRAEHLYNGCGIILQLQRHACVISDRYLFSSLAYQGAAGFYDLAKTYNQTFPLPEMLFYFDIDVDESFRRIEKRGMHKEIYEAKKFQAQVKEEYKKVLDTFSAGDMKIITIDANKTIEETSAAIMAELAKHFNLNVR